MAKETAIQWTDSTVNAVMGCDGCELWNPAAGVFRCYAGNETERKKGLKGWPESFDKPKVFPGRISDACRWPDLQGKPRPSKPWLDYLPRTIFLNDMSDSFTESINPRDWLEWELPHMAKCPHVWQMLTKRPKQMFDFFRKAGTIPSNFVLMTTVTGRATLPRVDDLRQLRQVRAHVTLGLSVEPLIDDLGDYSRLVEGIDWLILGGESDQKQAQARSCDLRWLRLAVEAGKAAGVPTFVKQLGSRPVEDGKPLPRVAGDSHRGKWENWPEDLRVRQMPDLLYVGDGPLFRGVKQIVTAK
jgi:protein gp37